MAAISSKRLGKELAELQADKCPTGITLVEAEDLKTWKLSIEVLGESVFKVGMTNLRSPSDALFNELLD